MVLALCGGAGCGDDGDGRVLAMVGDSLAVGTEAELGRLLSGWEVRTDALRGRPLADGMRVFGETDVPDDAVVAFSLFTNDVPQDVDALDQAVRASARRGGCAIWATIVRPPYRGTTYDEANARLRALDRELGDRVTVVGWAETVAKRPELLLPDGVHGTEEGYRVRAELYADAARRCPAG